MATQVHKTDNQVTGQFDWGKIKEFKPVGFPQERGGVKSFSTLFYWANAWSDQGGLIDIHPHKGFEILSYVVEGAIEHYDTLQQKWLRLEAGGLQIIRSGSGISHAERLLPGSRMYQIWLDPNLNVTLGQAPSYDDIKNGEFPVSEENGIKITHLSGNNSPLKHQAQAELKRLDVQAGEHRIKVGEAKIAGLMVMEGSIEHNGEQLNPGDFIKTDGTDQEIILKSDVQSALFLISVPLQPDYQTYASQYS